MTKKVLLINPKLPQRTTQLNIPTSLLYLGTWLSNEGYDVNILDAFNHNANKQFYNRLQDELTKEVLAIGLSVMTSQIPSAIEISQFIRTLSPETPIVWGGIHTTLYPRQVVESLYADFAVRDEGEITATELLGALENQRNFYAIKGLTFKDNEEVITNLDREPMDLNRLPCPNINLLEDVRNIGDIRKVTKLAGRGLPLLTSKGCPHRCTFCINSITRQAYRVRNASLVIKDLQELLTQGLTEIGFVDEDFLAIKPRLVQILDGIEEHHLKFKWFGTARADYFRKNHINYNLLKRLKENGCCQLGVGLESGSQRVLDLIKKDITLEEGLNATRLLEEVKVGAVFGFMMGIPGETMEEIRKTVDLVLRTTSLSSSPRVLPFIYRPYAGSELYNKCVELGMKEPKTLEDWIDNPYIGDNINPKDYNLFPWIQYPVKELIRLIFYCWMSGLRLKGLGLTKIVRKIGAWRLRHSCTTFPIEMWLLTLFRKLNLESKIGRGKFN